MAWSHISSTTKYMSHRQGVCMPRTQSTAFPGKQFCHRSSRATLGTQVHTYRCVYLCNLDYVGYAFGTGTQTYLRVPVLH